MCISEFRVLRCTDRYLPYFSLSFCPFSPRSIYLSLRKELRNSHFSCTSSILSAGNRPLMRLQKKIAEERATRNLSKMIFFPPSIDLTTEFSQPRCADTQTDFNLIKQEESAKRRYYFSEQHCESGPM